VVTLQLNQVAFLNNIGIIKLNYLLKKSTKFNVMFLINADIFIYSYFFLFLLWQKT